MWMTISTVVDLMAERPVFVDTGYFVALLNQRDQLHTVAASLAEEWRQTNRAAVTTDAVLIELGNFFARSPLRRAAIAAIRKVRDSSAFDVVTCASTLLERGVTRYASHDDKSWSLTDCLSMEVMLDTGCQEAATPDHHFAQAGFRILMRG
jgi:uncharacterized protein